MAGDPSVPSGYLVADYDVTRTLLIDADIIAYMSAAGNEQNIDWGDGVTSHHADFDASKEKAADEIAYLVTHLKADHALICLSDDFENFRNGVWAPYKKNRVSSRRPEHLYDMKEWLTDNYDTRWTATLEADDVMGILATEPHDGERIIVSEDKDMRTIPALVYHPHRPKNGVMKITELDATRFLFWQTICGDPTDGYPGVKGVGKGSPFATDVLEAEDELEAWEHVLDAYQSKGKPESDAVIQCNLARILKHGEYAEGRVVPWVQPYLEKEVN